jgi:hypothetical protein
MHQPRFAYACQNSNLSRYIDAASKWSHTPHRLVDMRRVQFIELHEQPWFPSSARDEITDALQFGLNFLRAYAPITPLLRSVLDATEERSIVDLCSGGGGPWLDLSRRLQGDTQASFQIRLTDKYPNLRAFQNAQEASENRITFYPDPVDAMKVPHEVKGFRTMFTSFHHFRPEEAHAVLQNAVDASQSIAIFEITRRAPSTIGLMFPWALTPLLFTPLIRPFRWSRLLWTYVLPIIPLVLLFDGVVSCLRTYRPQELREIIARLTATEYQWELGEHSGGLGGMPITYLIGYPRAYVSPSSFPPHSGRMVAYSEIISNRQPVNRLVPERAVVADAEVKESKRGHSSKWTEECAQKKFDRATLSGLKRKEASSSGL